MKKFKRSLMVLVGLVFALVLTGCSQSAMNGTYYYYEDNQDGTYTLYKEYYVKISGKDYTAVTNDKMSGKVDYNNHTFVSDKKSGEKASYSYDDKTGVLKVKTNDTTTSFVKEGTDKYKTIAKKSQ
ncbi:hypothetical protein [Streptococcus macacae]|uniref:Lipoprotein n=1 Tax=Streptococcus macacae NCTC 11558 TaxID=764298 RepID=G5JWG7_9STRE|nr:hypothetical protein [Streptococcus macacae]EHJ53051.1 hypothetical protein STRMA_0939 [Streptococcus macacae NCTC 11558]SUN78747.1 Uncharacterised protein [Streptococcus macacae NCTC 11558]